MKIVNKKLLIDTIQSKKELVEMTHQVEKIFEKFDFSNRNFKILYHLKSESPVLDSDQIEIVADDFFIQFATDMQKHLVKENDTYAYYSVFECVACGRTNPITWEISN